MSIVTTKDGFDFTPPELGTTTHEKTEWIKHYIITPVTLPPMNQRMAMAPGTCVKTKGRELMKLALGRVCDNGEDTGLGCVIGHGWFEHPMEIFVWSGTRAEFLASWVVD